MNQTSSTITLKSQAKLSWELSKTELGWVLGTLALDGKPVERAAGKGVLCLRNLKTGERRWLPARWAEQTNKRTVRLTGQADVEGVTFQFNVTVALEKSLAAVRVSPEWSVSRYLDDWEVCLAYQDEFDHDWRVQSYPWAGNSAKVDISPMRYCGVPGVLVYRPDLSMVAIFALDSNSDYLNPTTWTGQTGFHFANREVAPQFRVGGTLKVGIRYEQPWQLILSDTGEFSATITGLMQAWIAVNNFRVDGSLAIRTPTEAFRIIVEGHRSTALWNPGRGYQHHSSAPFIYVGNNPLIAYGEYRLYEVTGEQIWRDRAFEQIDFAIQGRQADPAKPHFGVMHTTYNLTERQNILGFCSWDWGHNGYKVDLNVWMARYILQTWQRVKEKEGIDRQDWYQAAMDALQWVLHQQNGDGGLPQVVNIETSEKSPSVVCGRALVALPMIAAITGDQRFAKVSEEMERFLRQNVEGRFWYTGMHPDLPPADFEQDSVWAVIEYWLNKHDQNGDKECLERAVANAFYGLLYWCPKQLSWVKNPTQCAHSEQQHYNQYSVYCYGNRKIHCLDRLFKETGNPLFAQLRDRVLQLNFFVQVAHGQYKGAMMEAIADPWLERRGGFDWLGVHYTSELVIDLMLQLMDLGLVERP